VTCEKFRFCFPLGRGRQRNHCRFWIQQRPHQSHSRVPIRTGDLARRDYRGRRDAMRVPPAELAGISPSSGGAQRQRLYAPPEAPLRLRPLANGRIVFLSDHTADGGRDKSQGDPILLLDHEQQLYCVVSNLLLVDMSVFSGRRQRVLPRLIRVPPGWSGLCFPSAGGGGRMDAELEPKHAAQVKRGPKRPNHSVQQHRRDSCASLDGSSTGRHARDRLCIQFWALSSIRPLV
jgi:hypothetical protein